MERKKGGKNMSLLLKVAKLTAFILFCWGCFPIIIKFDKEQNKVIPLGHYKKATALELFILTTGVFIGGLIAL
jgi:hypothetical protein